MTDTTATEGLTTKVQSILPDAAAEPVQQVAQSAQQAVGQMGDQVRQQLTTRSTQAGEQLQAVTEALRSSSQQLRSQGNDVPAKVLDPAVEKVEQLAAYLKESDADRLLHDLENLGRRQPWTAIAGGVAVGFLASRFLKASSRRRYEQRQSGLSGRSSAQGGWSGTQPYASHLTPAYATQPYPAQPYPAQPYPAQPYAQPYGAQPYEQGHVPAPVADQWGTTGAPYTTEYDATRPGVPGVPGAGV